MNAIRATRALNQKELDAAIPPSASWHVDYRDTAYIYIGGLPLDLSEGDVITIFSQYGNPTHLNLVRDKDTGKSRGFAFLKYEDQRSCDLAVDNLGGAEVMGRMLRVDHSRYKKKEGEDEDTWRIERLENGDGGAEDTGGESVDADEEGERRRNKKRRVLKEERELDKMLAITTGEEEDPMREYLIREKKEEFERAREREKDKDRRHRHKEKHRHREANGEESEDRRERSTGDRHRSRRHRDRDEEGKDSHKPRRSRDRKDDVEDRDGHRSRKDYGRDEDGKFQESRRHRDREPGSIREVDESRHRHRERSRSSDDRDRRRDRSRDRSDDKDRQVKHRRKDYVDAERDQYRSRS